jgi:two-component SAPR family response regulator
LPLTLPDVKAILTSLFGLPDLDVLAAQLQQYAEGNPYYLTELVHELIEQGVVKNKAAHWTLTSPPKSLRFLSERRYAQCTTAEQALLQELVLSGDPSHPEQLSSLDAAESLVRKGLVSRSPDGLLHYTHSLMREFVRSRISDTDKQVYFNAVIEKSETQHPIACQSSDLATHLARRTTPLGTATAKFLMAYSREQMNRFQRHHTAEQTLEALLRCGAALPEAVKAEATVMLATVQMKLEKFDDGLRLLNVVLDAEDLPPVLVLETHAVRLQMLFYHRRETFTDGLKAAEAFEKSARKKITDAQKAAWNKASLTIRRIVALSHFISGRYAEAREIYKSLLEHPQFSFSYPEVAANLSGIETIFNNYREAERYARLALDYYTKFGTEIELAQGLVNLANVLFEEGKLAEARDCASDAVGRCGLIGLDGRDEKQIFYTALFMLGVSNLHLMNYDEAERQLARCAEHFRQDKYGENRLVVQQAFTDFYLQTDQPLRAEAEIDDALKLLERHPNPLSEMFFWLRKAGILWQRDAFAEAEQFIRKAEKQTRQGQFENWKADVAEAKAQVAFAQDDFQAAQTLFEEAARRYASDKHDTLSEMQCYHNSAMAALHLGTEKSLSLAVKHHREALDLARKMQLDKRLASFETAFVSHPNAAKLKLKISKSQPLAESQPENIHLIRIYGFTPLVMFQAGCTESVAKREWGSEKPRKLVAYLVAKHGEPSRRTKERLFEALWPEVNDPKKLSALLRVALTQIRKALAAPDIIQKTNEIYSINPMAIWADWMAFEKQLKAGVDAIRQGQFALAEEQLQKAKALYAGHFLAEMDDDWIVETRTKLADLYDAVLRHLSQLAEQRQDYAQAISLCEQRLSHNAESEAVYQDAIRLYALAGNNVQATHTYEACCEMLREEFGLKPSKTLEDTYAKYVLHR